MRGDSARIITRWRVCKPYVTVVGLAFSSGVFFVLIPVTYSRGWPVNLALSSLFFALSLLGLFERLLQFRYKPTERRGKCHHRN